MVKNMSGLPEFAYSSDTRTGLIRCIEIPEPENFQRTLLEGVETSQEVLVKVKIITQEPLEEEKKCEVNSEKEEEREFSLLTGQERPVSEENKESEKEPAPFSSSPT